MRKIIVSMNVTLDGFMSGLHCELDWHFESWNSEMAESLCRQLADADTILLGRTTYTAMARYWNAKAIDMHCSREDIVFAEMMNRYTKVVVSHSLTTTAWSNTILLNGNIAEEIRSLKQQEGKSMMVYGSGKLLSTLQELDMVDEYQLWIHPVIIRAGKTLFKNRQSVKSLELLKQEVFSSGVVLLYYRCKQ